MGDKRQGHDTGRNLGQGLGNITDRQRRDLAGSGDAAPTRDQATRETSGEQDLGDERRGHDEE